MDKTSYKYIQNQGQAYIYLGIGEQWKQKLFYLWKIGENAIVIFLDQRFGFIRLLYNIIIIKQNMGNQNAVPEYQNRVRYRTGDSRRGTLREPGSVNNSFEMRSKVNTSFATPPPKSINRSFDIKNPSEYSEQEHLTLQPITKKKQNRFQSLDIDDYEPSRRETPRMNNDRVLDSLSKKNHALRIELKKINDELTAKLNRKKLVPKRTKQTDNSNAYEVEAEQKKYVGLKRELENGYKQIQMYKKTIEGLKGKAESDTSEYRLRILEGNVADMDKEIQRYIKRVEGVKKIKTKQDLQIEKDINDDLREGVETYKHEAEALKKKLKEYANRDRMREGNYKKQQAYLCDLERKMREMNGQYFPDLKAGISHRKQFHQKTAASDKQRVNPKQFKQVEEEARTLRSKHEEYYRKIDALLKFINRSREQQNWLKEQIVYKERIIEALRNKMSGFRNLSKPRKNGLFGYSGGGNGTEGMSEYEDTPSEIQRQLIEELNQDQFDIKHLIANIPKPIRKRPEQMSNGYSSDDSSKDPNTTRRKKGMVITNEKAEPKKWGAISTRTEQRGTHFKQQLTFQDRGHFNGDVQPLIVGVNVWIDKNNVILAVQAIYLNKGEIRYGAKSAETTAAAGTKRFDLQSPDYLKNISMTMGQQGFVESLTFHSKQGKVGKFGNKRSSDQNVNFGLSSNQRPFLFLGASTLYEAQPRINVLGVQICQD